MTLKTLLLASVCTLGLAGAASALDQSAIDRITGPLAEQGYTNIHIKVGPSGVKVEAIGPNGKIEQYFDTEGNYLGDDSNGGGFSGGDSSDDDDLDDDGSDDDDDHDSSDDDQDDDQDDDSDDDSNDDDDSDDDSDDDNDDDEGDDD